MPEHTVKARVHQGTKSLDITIPAQIAKECNISHGDIFKISVNKDKSVLKIEYTRVYSNK